MAIRRTLLLLALTALAAGQAGPALATTPVCSATISKLRYRPHYDVSCNANITAVDSFVRVSTGGPVGYAATGTGSTAVGVDANVALVPGALYRLRVWVDDGSGPALWGTTWRTLAPPAHPNLHVKYITAIPPDAVLDIAHRMDAANIFAVPRASDFVDASTQTLTAAQYGTALQKHQAALVVTDLPVLGTRALANALVTYCGHGHGVVLAGQDHWQNADNWTVDSEVGWPGDPWGSKWSLFAYADINDPTMIAGGDLATSSVKPHFLTKGLQSFHVIGYGSGSIELQDYAQGKELATLKRPASGYFGTYGAQSFIAEHQLGAARVVDLGFRPWASTVSGGGFDPAVSAGGALTARALWWAMNRIPPTGTHFTSKPSNPSNRSTLIIAMGSKDSDEEFGHAPHYLYRVDGGRWKHAVGTSFVLYHIATGRYHTLQAKAVDSGGNVDPHPASYRFYVLPGAMG